MAKEDLTLVRLLRLGDEGKDIVALKRMLSRAGVGFPPQVRVAGKFNDHFGPKLDAAVRRFQKKNKLEIDGIVGYMTFKALVGKADAFDSKLLSSFSVEQIGDWGIFGRRSAFAGLDMGVDFLGAGPIPMFADGVIVRIVRTGSGWPGIGGLIVVQCDKGPMARFPIYTAEDIKIPASHTVGKRLAKGDLLADANRDEASARNRARLGRSQARLPRHALSGPPRPLLGLAQSHRRGNRLLEDALRLDGEGRVTAARATGLP